MGRSKIPIEFIKKDKKRSTTYDKRKKGLLKKAYELATLCDVPLCVVVYPGPGSAPVTYPEKEEEVRAVIERYESGSRDVNPKRNINLKRGLELGKKKKGVDDQCLGGAGGGDDLDGLSREELVKMRSSLDYKLNQVEERIRMAAGQSVGIDHRMMQWPIAMWQPDQGWDHVGGSSSGGHVGGVGGSSYDHKPNLFMGPNCYDFGHVGSSALVKFEPQQYISEANPTSNNWYEQGKLFF